MHARVNIVNCLPETLFLAAQSVDGAPIILLPLIALAGLAFVGLWIWSLIHCIQNRMLSDNNRLIGIILIALLGLLGSFIYLFLPRESTPQR